jgi:lactam utilization protein B
MHVPRERRCAPAAKTNAGQLDRDFAHFGIAQVYFAGSVSSMTQGLALDPQGRVLVAAKIGTADGSRFGWRECFPTVLPISASALKAA